MALMHDFGVVLLVGVSLLGIAARTLLFSNLTCAGR